MRVDIKERPVVIVVDDEPENTALLVRALSDSYAVAAFNDAQAALAAAIANPPAAVVTDYRMPGLNGVELVRALRSARVGAAALMVTAYPEVDDIVEAEQQRLFFRIVTKPWSPKDLKAQTDLAVSSWNIQRAALHLEQAAKSRSTPKPTGRKPSC
jgi:CheY-like chemotaxis protein